MAVSQDVPAPKPVDLAKAGPSPEDVFSGKAPAEVVAAAGLVNAPGDQALEILEEAADKGEGIDKSTVVDLVALLKGEV